MKLTVLKFLTFLLTASLFTVVFLSFRAPSNPGSREKFSAAISEVLPLAPKENRVLLQAQAGGGVWVNNFYNFAEGYWPDKDVVLIKKTGAYSINYYRANSSFEILMSLQGGAADKAGAEQTFFNILGVGKPDLCRLDVYVSELDSAGDKLSSPLDFCSRAFKD